MTFAPPTDHPTLIIIRGIPGSGKSYLASAFVESLDPGTVVLIDPDQIDQSSQEFKDLSESLSADGVDEKFHPYRFLRTKAYDAITANKIIIWNQAFIDFNGFEITVNRLKEFAEAHNIKLNILVVEVSVSPETAKKRIADRKAKGGHDVPDNVHAKFIDQFESFVDKGYAVVSINGEGDISLSVDNIKKALGK